MREGWNGQNHERMDTEFIGPSERDQVLILRADLFVEPPLLFQANKHMYVMVGGAATSTFPKDDRKPFHTFVVDGNGIAWSDHLNPCPFKKTQVPLSNYSSVKGNSYLLSSKANLPEGNG